MTHAMPSDQPEDIADTHYVYPLYPVVSAELGDVPDKHAFALLRLHAPVTAPRLTLPHHHYLSAHNFAIVTQAA